MTDKDLEWLHIFYTEGAKFHAITEHKTLPAIYKKAKKLTYEYMDLFYDESLKPSEFCSKHEIFPNYYWKWRDAYEHGIKLSERFKKPISNLVKDYAIDYAELGTLESVAQKYNVSRQAVHEILRHNKYKLVYVPSSAMNEVINVIKNHE